MKTHGGVSSPNKAAAIITGKCFIIAAIPFMTSILKFLWEFSAVIFYRNNARITIFVYDWDAGTLSHSNRFLVKTETN